MGKKKLEKQTMKNTKYPVGLVNELWGCVTPQGKQRVTP